MASPTPEATGHLPTVHEYGQRALGDHHSTAGAVAQPSSVSPQTTEATPVAHHAEPVSPEQQHGQTAQPETQRDAGVVNTTAANTTAADPQQQPNHVHAEEKTSHFSAWKRRHMLLILVALILSIIGLGFSAHAAASGAFDLSSEASILAIPIPIYILTIVFAIAETAVRASLKFKKGLHPAVHVGVWLICWIIYAGLVAAFAIIVNWTLSDYDYYYDDERSFYHGQFIAQFVFICLLLLVTFVLFITACIDAQAYNVAKATMPPADATGKVDPDYHEDRAWRVTKLVFNVLVILFGIIGFAIGLSMVRFGGVDSYSDSGIVFPACACAMLLAVVWAIADLCFSLTGPRRRLFQGIHPGAHVGMWLVVWIILAIVGGILTTFAVMNVARCRDWREHNERRSVVALDTAALTLNVPVVDTAVVPNHVRQVNGVTSLSGLPTPTTTSSLGGMPTLRPTSTSIRGSLPTTTSSPFDSDPYDPYGDDPDEEDPYYTYPYRSSSYTYPYRTSSSYTRTSSTYSSRPTDSLNSPYDDDPYGDRPRTGNYYDDPYDEDDLDGFCARTGAVGPMVATCVFMWIVFVFAFVLFVAACADTYLRNHLRNPWSVVYVPVPAMAQQQPYQQQQYQYPQQPMYSNGPMMQQGVGQPTTQQQGPVVQQQPARGNVVEYYGTAQ